MNTWTSISDITREEWIKLNFELEKYDKSGQPYDIVGNKLLSFILYQIYQNPMNFMKVPAFLRNGPQFQELAALYNKQLRSILFPTRNAITVNEAIFMRKITGFGLNECKKLLETFDSLVDAVNYLRKNSDEPQYDGLTEGRFDVLDREGNIVFTCKTAKEAEQSGYSHLYYRIRGVDKVGRYTYVK